MKSEHRMKVPTLWNFLWMDVKGMNTYKSIMSFLSFLFTRGKLISCGAKVKENFEAYTP